MNDFELCSKAMEPDGACQLCKRNPANTEYMEDVEKCYDKILNTEVQA